MLQASSSPWTAERETVFGSLSQHIQVHFRKHEAIISILFIRQHGAADQSYPKGVARCGYSAAADSAERMQASCTGLLELDLAGSRFWVQHLCVPPPPLSSSECVSPILSCSVSFSLVAGMFDG